MVERVFSIEEFENISLKDGYSFENITKNYQGYKNYKITKIVDNQKIGNNKQAKNVIKLVGMLNPIVRLSTNTYMSPFSYERVLAKSVSLSIYPMITRHTVGVILTQRWYPSKTKYTPSGWFWALPVSLLLQSTNDSIFYSPIQFHWIKASVGVGGGYQWIFRNGFALDIFADIGYERWHPLVLRLEHFQYLSTQEITYYVLLAGVPTGNFGVSLGYAF